MNEVASFYKEREHDIEKQQEKKYLGVEFIEKTLDTKIHL